MSAYLNKHCVFMKNFILKNILLVFLCSSLFFNKKVYAGDDGGDGGGGVNFENIGDLNTSQGLEEFICNVLGYLTGGVGKALAAFACIGISLAFLGGKVSWTLVLTFSLGMACIFGAPVIIRAFAGGATACEGVGQNNT